MNENENLFVPASMGYDHEMVPKSKDWVERLNPDSILSNFNTGRVLVPESQAVNESLKPTETLITPESSKDSKAESIIPLHLLKNLQGASQSLEILKAKAKPFPPCTHYGFNDHKPDDCRHYPECRICRSYDHFTSGHNRVIHIRGGVLAESSQSSESSTGIKCNTYESTVYSTANHNEFDYFKKGSVCFCFIWIYLDQKNSQAPEMIMSFIRMVENQNDVKVKQIRTDNRAEFRNHELEIFCNEKGISQNFSSLYTPKQNGMAERKNRTLIEAARTILNGSDRLGKFDAKADDGYFLGYPFVSKAFKVLNIRRQQVEETYNVKFDEMIDPNEPDIPLTDDNEGPLDLINTKGTHEQNVQNKQIPTQPTEGPLRNNNKISVSINETVVLDVPQSHIYNQASASSHPVPQDRWSKDQHIELVNIIGDPGEGMITGSMATKLTATLASKYLFTKFLSKIEPKKVSKVPNRRKELTMMKPVVVFVRDFYKKFYNSLGTVPNCCSSSIGKAQGLLLFSRGIESSRFELSRCGLTSLRDVVTPLLDEV
uniref:Retrovirus-related Pol polyprotein from transposon TNT 1-94 n=1 Tax=Tanacetum cinerariifolium TaxID=118510 RepID=A0A699GTW7_TANCI|nr:retrovirus-related Pol polyprotein from transposon TNT 1-94 [Tanacetum cinerariifolium]